MRPTIEPEPYVMEKVLFVAVHVVDDEQLNLLCSKHALSVQPRHGTHRFDEPVSNNIWKVFGGVPMVIGPYH